MTTVDTHEDLRRASRLLDELAQVGIRLWLDGDKLQCSAPKERVTDSLLNRIRAEKGMLIQILKEKPPISPVAGLAIQATRSGVAPMLTLAQQDLLPIALARAADPRYNIPVAVLLPGRIDAYRMNLAQNILQARHESLRMCFPNGVAAPLLRPRAIRVAIEQFADFPAQSPVDRRAFPQAALTALAPLVAQPFDLCNGPLWRSVIVNDGEHASILLFVFHHLIFDGFSRDIYLRELAGIYSQLGQGGLPESETGCLQSSEFAARERQLCSSIRVERARSWWRERFIGGATATALPRAPTSLLDVPAPGSRVVEFPSTLVQAIRSRIESARLPMLVFLLLASGIALHRVTSQVRLLFCTPLANRGQPRADQVIGYLNRVLPLILDLSGSGTLAGQAASMTRDLFEADGHRCLSLAEIIESASLRAPINRVMVAWQERSDVMPCFGTQRGSLLPLGRSGTDFELSLQFEGRGDNMSCRLDWGGNVFAGDAADRFAALLQNTVETLGAADWSLPVADFLAPLVNNEAIATVLQGDPGVDEVVVTVDRGTGLHTAWLVLNEFNVVASEALYDRLNAHLGALLPPLRMVTVVALPRDASGGIDLAALAEHGRETEIPPFIAPVNALQATICGLWSRILWLNRPVGIREDFKALGGHSLLAVRMLAELELILDRPLPSSTIRRLGTIEALAAAISHPESPSADDDADSLATIVGKLVTYTACWGGWRRDKQSLIVGRNVGGTRTPLFWCLQNENELNQLERYLGAEQPVLGMRSGNHVMVKSGENIKRLAGRYADEIAALQPDGPLFLGGNCQAAVIAFQIAKHLESRGRSIALLILHEKMIPEPYAGTVALTYGRESDRNPYLYSKDPLSDFRAFYSGKVSVDLVGGAHGQFFREPNIIELATIIRKRRDDVEVLLHGGNLLRIDKKN